MALTILQIKLSFSRYTSAYVKKRRENRGQLLFKKTIQ